jgi:aldose 1-epimerase
MKQAIWDILPDGRGVSLYTLENEYIRVTVSDLGATVTELALPDRQGQWRDVALGFDTPEEYLTKPGNLGATIGRYAGRIANGRFPLNGEMVQLMCNRGKHTIHGGPDGFHRRLWTVEEFGKNRIVLQLVSPDGDQGFPGTVTCRTALTMMKNSLTMEFWAESDRDTVCSLTSHTYWNLAGHNNGTVDGHVLMVDSETCLETNEETIPTGEFLPFEGLRQGAVLNSVEVDHTLMLREGDEMRFAARLEDPESGRWMELFTDLPGLQVYTGDHLPEGMGGKNGAVYGQRSGVCLEPQSWPDSPNHPHFPNTILWAGETMHHAIRWEFGVV